MERASHRMRSARSGASRGAHAVEYAMLIAVVAAAMGAMQTYVRRAVQAHLKNIELRLNESNNE